MKLFVATASVLLVVILSKQQPLYESYVLWAALLGMLIDRIVVSELVKPYRNGLWVRAKLRRLEKELADRTAQLDEYRAQAESQG